MSHRILYVDDDQDGCEMISLWLSQHKYSVVTVNEGQQAMELIKRSKFDLFLLDFALPDMTAVTLCQHIRKTDQVVPIIVYSALSRGVDQEAAISAGVTKYLVKPNDLEKLVPEIELNIGSRIESPPRYGSVFRRRAASIL